MDQVLKRRFDAIDAPIDRRSVMTELPSGKHFVKLSDRRAAPESASTGERTVASRELPPHTLRRTVIPIKFFHAAAVMLAITALGVGQSAAQTGAPSPGGIAATSPLGADFGQTSGDDQSTGAAGVASPAPCTNGPPGGAAPSTFNGGGLSPTSSFTTSGIPAGLGAASGTSAPCNSVSRFRGYEYPEFRNHDHTECKFFLISFIRIVESRKPDDGNGKQLAEYREPWRNRPRHEQSWYDGTRDDRPRLTADPVRIDIANRNVAINSGPIRDIMFRRPQRAADE